MCVCVCILVNTHKHTHTHTYFNPRKGFYCQQNTVTYVTLQTKQNDSCCCSSFVPRIVGGKY